MSILESVMGIFGRSSRQLIAMLFEHSGGVDDLIDKFKSGGLKDVVESWISTGRNLPVSSDEVEKVLGSDMLNKMAAKTGLDPSELSSKIAKYLPQIVDKLSPKGKLTSEDKND